MMERNLKAMEKSKAFYIGIDIGGTKIAYGLFDENRNLLEKYKCMSDDSLEAEAYFGNVVDELKGFLTKTGTKLKDIKGIGIGIAGYVDFENGLFIRNASLPKLRNFYVVQFIKEKLGENIHVVMDNDCHCGALAEYRRGAGRHYKNMVYCPVSTGISSGIIVNSELFRGSNGASGESGHMISAVEGNCKIKCGCGNEGCFNSLCSGKAIIEHIKKWIKDGEKTSMIEIAGGIENITTVHIDQAYEEGDVMAIKAVDQMVKYLSIWLFDVYMLLNIDCIVFSGGLLSMGDKLLKRVEEKFKSYQTNGFKVNFYQTELGAESGLIGAVELLFDK